MQSALAKPRVAWFSVLHGQSQSSSCSAYFSSQLLPRLKEKFEIELFHDSFLPYQDYPTYHYLTAVQHHQQNPYDIFFYQLEDSRACDFTRMHLGLIPGVVLFHDFIFSSDGPEPMLNSPWEKVLHKFHDPNAPWPERDEKHKRKGPAAFREAALAGVPLFSSEKDHAEFKRLIKYSLRQANSEYSLDSFFLPHPVAMEDLKVPQARPRAERWCLAFCGTPRIEQRAHVVLQALAGAKFEAALLWLVGDEAERRQAEELLKEFEIEKCEIITGRSPGKWQALLERGDIALHPLFGVYGQPGPYLSISLCAGLPCLVSKFGAADYLPDNLVFKITPGAGEAYEMQEALSAIINGQAALAGAEISAYARELHDAQMVAQELGWIFEYARPYLRALQARWSAFEKAAHQTLLREVYALAAQGGAWEGIFEPAFEDLGWV